jgi:cephalosporin-C deacetylase-like acetyl esterase
MLLLLSPPYYKKSRDKHYPWKSTNYIILEMAVRGISKQSLSSSPSPQELKAVYIRLKLKIYKDLQD